MKADQDYRHCLFMSTLTALLICLGATCAGASETSGIQIPLYNLCEYPNTLSSLDLDRYKKDEITITAWDPNFTELGNAHYKGIPLSKLLSESPCLTKQNNLTFTILANDQYVLHDALDKSGGILSYDLNSKPIPLKFGGPLKVVYQTFPSQEASIWHVTSIVMGTLEKPALCLIKKNGNKVCYDIDRLKTMNSKVETIPFMLPRGYRTEKNMPKRINVRYLPLERVLQAGDISNTSFTMETYSGHRFEVKKIVHLKQLFLVFQLDEKNIPVQWGGPFILAFKSRPGNFFANKQPYYFVHTIRMLCRQDRYR